MLTKQPMAPAISYKEAKELFLARELEENFMNFNYSTKNPFVRKVLYLRQHGFCPHCGKRILDPKFDAVVHHQTYAHFCDSEHPTIRAFLPRKQNRSYRTVPNCELCYFTSPQKADKCLSCFVLLHDSCHKEIHSK